MTQAIDKLKLDGEVASAGARPTALGMHSCVGTEYVAFKKSLPLDGKVVFLPLQHELLPARYCSVRSSRAF